MPLPLKSATARAFILIVFLMGLPVSIAANIARTIPDNPVTPTNKLKRSEQSLREVRFLL
ncbi:MAG: hypothetical protein P8L49_00200 [Opitutaceae bacterium]|nr:hypothetical protein [Opitutaceae bacterium]